MVGSRYVTDCDSTWALINVNLLHTISIRASLTRKYISSDKFLFRDNTNSVRAADNPFWVAPWQVFVNYASCRFSTWCYLLRTRSVLLTRPVSEISVGEQWYTATNELAGDIPSELGLLTTFFYLDLGMFCCFRFTILCCTSVSRFFFQSWLFDRRIVVLSHAFFYMHHVFWGCVSCFRTCSSNQFLGRDYSFPD